MLTPQKRKALQALLTQPTKAEAAQAAGIDQSTLRRYLHDDAFVEEYRAAVVAMIDDASREARQILHPALTTLREIIEDKDAGATARITAARTIIDCAIRFTELNDIISRIEELEQEVQAGCARH